MAGWPSGSFVGVDVFFVISGYLITGILLREFGSRRTISFRGFYARRIKRILPAGLFVIGATVCATRVLAGIDRYHFAAKDAIAAVLFDANWHFAATGVNYFNQALPPSPLQHYWSLSVEEQFYFVWPWLLLGLLLMGLRLRFWRHEHARVVAGIAIALISGISLAWAFSETASSPTAAYFSTFVRAWELGLGALVAIAAEPIARCDARLRRVVVVVGLVGVLCSLFVVPSRSGFPAPWALLPDALGRRRARRRRRPLRTVAATADQPGQPVHGQDLLQPLSVALPGARPDRHRRPPILGGLLVGGSGADFRAVRCFVSSARGSCAARDLVSTAPGPPSDSCARLAAIRRRLRGHRGPGRSRPRRRPGDQPDQARAWGAGPDRPYTGRSAQLHRSGRAGLPPSLRQAEQWRPGRAIAWSTA